MEKELQIHTTDIRFQAVHRIVKSKESRNRPITARFVCREDRDRVFSRKQALKDSRRYRDAYVTADYAKAIQEERRKHIKATFKAKEQGLKDMDGGRVGLVVRALAFHQCGPGSISALGVIRGLSLLVLYSAMRGFPPGTPVFPSHQKPTFDLICRKTVVNLNDLNNVDLISFQ